VRPLEGRAYEVMWGEPLRLHFHGFLRFKVEAVGGREQRNGKKLEFVAGGRRFLRRMECPTGKRNKMKESALKLARRPCPKSKTKMRTEKEGNKLPRRWKGRGTVA